MTRHRIADPFYTRLVLTTAKEYSLFHARGIFFHSRINDMILRQALRNIALQYHEAVRTTHTESTDRHPLGLGDWPRGQLRRYCHIPVLEVDCWIWLCEVDVWGDAVVLER